MNLRVHAAPALVFLAAFAAYLGTMAPTVTFEDSGELVTAAWLLGVPHEPGYPLWTLLAHAFTWLPAGTVAWRVALLSAAGMALGAALIARATLEALRGGTDATASLADELIAAAAGLMAAYACEAWEQALIAEVYGLNFALAAALFWLAVRWAKEPGDTQRRRLFYGASLLLGLAVGHHPTNAVLAVALLIYVALTGLRRVLDLRTLAIATALLLAGLLPLAYLPLASTANPALDWGDPDTPRAVLRVLLRAQYGIAPWSGFSDASAQALRFFSLMLEQWPRAAFVLPLAGFAWLCRAQRSLALLCALLFLAAGPLAAVAINLPLHAGDVEVDTENRALVSVFFIPAYGVLALLAGCGLRTLIAFARERLRLALAAASLLVPAAVALANASALDLSGHRWAEAYASNLFRDAPPRALVFANWDPFYFPLVYFQQVEGQRADLALVDPALLRRSWYVRQLQRHQPLMRRVEPQAGEFLAQVRPFEDGEPYDGVALERAWLALQTALIDAALAEGRAVLATQPLEPDVLRSDTLEPLVAALRLRRGAVEPQALALSGYRLAEFMDTRVGNDRMAVMMRRHFGAMLEARAQELAAWGDRQGAEEAAQRAVALLQPLNGASPR